MAEPQVLSTLHAKRCEIERHIKEAEKRLKQARHDLAHVNATIRLFEVNGETKQFPAYVMLKQMFPRGDLARLCKEALAASEDSMDTRQLALHVMAEKGWDASDRALAVSVAKRIVTTLDELSRRNRSA
jgi:hypothetical protein